MKWTDSLALLIAIAAASVVAGASSDTFLAAALAAAAASWRAFPPLSRCRQLFVNLDPHPQEPQSLPQALRYALDEVKRVQKPLLLRISPPVGRDSPSCQIDINRDYDVEIRRTGLRTAKLERRNVWIAEHPLPLTLPDARALCLRLSPSGSARVRVAPAVVPPCPRPLWMALTATAAAACLLDYAWMLSAALGFAFQTGLLAHFQNRLPADFQI